MIRSLDPLVSLPATDPARAHRFYRDLLGLEPVVEVPEDGFYIYRTPEPGDRFLGVHRHDGPIPPAEAQGLWLWLKVDEIAPVRAKLEAAGVRFLGEPTDLGPGRHVPFLDSEGNVLRLYEPIREVRREVGIDAPADRVWSLLTDATAVAAWFPALTELRLDPRPGGAISFTDTTFGPVTGRVTAFEPGRRLAFEFDANWPTHLEYRIEPRAGGVTLLVHQHGFDPIEARDFGIPGLIEQLDQAMALLMALAKVAGAGAGAVVTVKALAEEVVGAPRRKGPAPEQRG